MAGDLTSGELTQMYGANHPITVNAKRKEAIGAQQFARNTGIMQAPNLNLQHSMAGMPGAAKPNLHAYGDTGPGTQELWGQSAAAGQQFLNRTTPGLNQQGPQFQRWANDPGRIAQDQASHGLWSPERLAQETSKAQADLQGHINQMTASRGLPSHQLFGALAASQPRPGTSVIQPGGLLAGMQSPKVPQIQVPKVPQIQPPAPQYHDPFGPEWHMATAGMAAALQGQGAGARNAVPYNSAGLASSPAPMMPAGHGPGMAGWRVLDAANGMQDALAPHERAAVQRAQVIAAATGDSGTGEMPLRSFLSSRELGAPGPKADFATLPETPGRVGWGNLQDRARFAARQGNPTVPQITPPTLAPGTMEHLMAAQQAWQSRPNMASAAAADLAERLYFNAQDQAERSARIGGIQADTEAKRMGFPGIQAGNQLAQGQVAQQGFQNKMLGQTAEMSPLLRGMLAGLGQVFSPDQFKQQEGLERGGGNPRAPAAPWTYENSMSHLFGPNNPAMGAGNQAAIFPGEGGSPEASYDMARQLGYNPDDEALVAPFRAALLGKYGQDAMTSAGQNPNHWFSGPTPEEMSRAAWFRGGATPSTAPQVRVPSPPAVPSIMPPPRSAPTSFERASGAATPAQVAENDRRLRAGVGRLFSNYWPNWGG